MEILETVVATSPDDMVTRNINGLSALGCLIDLDDFGTGHASISSIRRFAIQRLKIDRSFVSDLETNSEAAAIVRAVVGLGRSLGIDTTAEGVETKDQLTYLRIEGCSEAQGFYYSKPRPQDEIPWLLKQDIGVLAEADAAEQAAETPTSE